MLKIKKYFGLSLLLIILIIPIFFGIFIEYLNINEPNIFVLTIFLLGVILFIILDEIIVLYGYNKKSIEVIKQQDVIRAFIDKNNKEIIWVFLPMIMLIEELIFRYYLIGFLLKQLEIDILLAILISSLIFSLFHIHIWFRFKNLRILIINLIDSFLLGIFNGYILIFLGLIPCVLIHYLLVLMLYYRIYKKYSKGNKNSI